MLSLSCLFSCLCHLELNPNLSTQAFFHRACVGGRADPRVLLHIVFSSILGLDLPPYVAWSPPGQDTRLEPPTAAATHVAPVSGAPSSSSPPPPHLLVPSGGTELTAPSSLKDAHR
jgi:hypothetical protein